MGPPFLFAAVAAVQFSFADTLVVRLPEADRPLPVREELRIGSLEGDAAEAFGYLSAVVANRDGRMFAVDAQAPSVVRMFDPAGTYLGDMGRAGQGPGEYVGIHGLALTPDEEVVVWDFNGQRLPYFDREGRHLRSTRIQASGLVGAAFPTAMVDSAGRVTVLVPEPRAVDAPSDRPREAVVAWIRFGPDGGSGDTLATPRRDVAGSYNAFKYETMTLPDGTGGIVWGRNDEYAFHRRLPDGRIVRIERPWRPAAIGGDERAQWMAHQEVWEERWGFESRDIGQVKPAWRHFFVDYERRIWVERYVAAVFVAPGPDDPPEDAFGWPRIDWVQPTVYDVIDLRGAYLGTVNLPPGSTFLFARGGNVWVRQEGEYDEHYLVQYGLDFEPGGGP